MSDYNPNRDSSWNYGGNNWKLSRSKIELFAACPRCFYIDNKLGTKRLSIPSFLINNAVDHQLKQEFDAYEQKIRNTRFRKNIKLTPSQRLMKK